MSLGNLENIPHRIVFVLKICKENLTSSISTGWWESSIPGKWRRAHDIRTLQHYNHKMPNTLMNPVLISYIRNTTWKHIIGLFRAIIMAFLQGSEQIVLYFCFYPHRHPYSELVSAFLSAAIPSFSPNSPFRFK